MGAKESVPPPPPPPKKTVKGTELPATHTEVAVSCNYADSLLFLC